MNLAQQENFFVILDPSPASPFFSFYLIGYLELLSQVQFYLF